MKKLFAMLLAVLLMLTAVPAFAADWSNREVNSPYSVGIVPVKLYTDIFGSVQYKQDFGTAEAGDNIAFAVRVEVPEKAQSATLTIKATNAVLNSSMTANIPTTQGVYYMNANGSLQSGFCVISGYCTGVPTIKASISGNTKVQSVGQYSIVRSDGFIFLNNGRGVAFYTDSTSKIYSARIILDGTCPGRNENSTKLTYEIMNDDCEAAWIARNALNALQINLSDLLAGNIFMNEKILAANFGNPIDCEYSKTWGETVFPVSTVPVPKVPATGILGDGFIIAGVIIMVGLVWLILKKISDVAEGKHEKHS